jgi:hypothetical protein
MLNGQHVQAQQQRQCIRSEMGKVCLGGRGTGTTQTLLALVITAVVATAVLSVLCVVLQAWRGAV